ncbi:hypothetical protein IC614_07985 [Allosphingosinicella flava]|uniref:Terminase n=1 Tax=Allosphingosinicella flava TaxID=2771430 RepID=A0A7T2GI30_9SPHN|nr:hypothetical protein [Sphingosinicella flava]QPQ54299.1 hypothetical protein IC614_07985 [Sphingosinicella flava]
MMASKKDGPRVRHDGFTPERQRRFLEALGKTGCVRDACRVAGVSSTAAYRARTRIAGFEEKWETALAMASTELEAVAWKRAVEGAEVVTVRSGEVVSTVRKPSDSMLRLLLQGANPNKYGRTARAADEKEVAARLRPKIEAEVRKGLKASPEELTEAILAKLAVLKKRRAAAREAAEGGRDGDAGADSGTAGQ